MIRDENSGWVEATIVINGKQLSFAEAMTVRVAVSTYKMLLSDAKFVRDLGAVGDGYNRCLDSVFEKIINR